MTQEEKAKRYDEAYEKVAIRFGSNVADEIFPELAESEDERIRKALIVYLKSILSNKKYGDKFIESWIDWLEKQGKNNMGISEATKQNLEDNLNKALEKETPESCNEFLEKQYSQILANSAKTCKDEQKPAWSEDDEKIIMQIGDAVEDYFPTPVADKIKTWLKSLKDRYTWKPSDRQIEILEHFVRSIGESGYASPYDNNTKLLYLLLSDLKKLREE